MAAPYHNLRSKLNRAITAYLISVGAGGPEDTGPANARTLSKYPRTTIRAGVGKAEPPLTGNYRVTVYISVKGSAVQDPKEPNPEAARIAFDTRLATVFDALMQSDDDQTLRATKSAINAAGRALAVAVDGSDEAIQFAANNADMVDFTVIGWYDAGFGDGEPNEEGTSWEEILIFEALACSSNVD
jgi:hypothetical protein